MSDYVSTVIVTAYTTVQPSATAVQVVKTSTLSLTSIPSILATTSTVADATLTPEATDLSGGGVAGIVIAISLLVSLAIMTIPITVPYLIQRSKVKVGITNQIGTDDEQMPAPTNNESNWYLLNYSLRKRLVNAYSLARAKISGQADRIAPSRSSILIGREVTANNGDIELGNIPPRQPLRTLQLPGRVSRHAAGDIEVKDLDASADKSMRVTQWASAENGYMIIPSLPQAQVRGYKTIAEAEAAYFGNGRPTTVWPSAENGYTVTRTLPQRIASSVRDSWVSLTSIQSGLLGSPGVLPGPAHHVVIDPRYSAHPQQAMVEIMTPTEDIFTIGEAEEHEVDPAISRTTAVETRTCEVASPVSPLPYFGASSRDSWEDPYAPSPNRTPSPTPSLRPANAVAHARPQSSFYAEDGRLCPFTVAEPAPPMPALMRASTYQVTTGTGSHSGGDSIRDGGRTTMLRPESEYDIDDLLAQGGLVNELWENAIPPVPRISERVANMGCGQKVPDEEKGAWG